MARLFYPVVLIFLLLGKVQVFEAGEEARGVSRILTLSLWERFWAAHEQLFQTFASCINCSEDRDFGFLNFFNTRASAWAFHLDFEIVPTTYVAVRPCVIWHISVCGTAGV